MADEELNKRIRAVLAGAPNVIEKRMFGGTGFMVRGNMACGEHKGYLIVRIGPEKFAEALTRPHTRVFDITGKPMAGWVMVGREGYEAEEDLKTWVQMGVEYALTLPAK